MKDLTGIRFGRLTVLSFYGRKISNSGKVKYMWECLCDCGNRIIVSADNLKNGHVKSCKCLRQAVSTQRIVEQGKNNIKHGLAGTRLYYAWHSMIERCYNPQSQNYKNYGGRGISVCEAWRKDINTFSEWAKEHGFDEKAPHGTCTLDRIDVNGDYCPDNCRWVDMKIQANNRRNNRRFFYQGETLTMSELAKKSGIEYALLKNRIAQGWSIEKAIETKAK